MTDREQQIAAAAARVFARYGIKRATMNDIADEAGVVRQTLYNVFANKDEVIHGTLLLYLQKQREQTEAGWKEAASLAERLDILFRLNVTDPWDVIQAMPDARDLETGNHVAAKSAIACAGADMRRSLADMFSSCADGLARNGHSPGRMASFVQATMISLKHEMTDRGELVAHLGTLKSLVLAAAGEAETST